MKWDKLKKNADKLQQELNDKSARELARQYDIDHKTVTFWADKQGIEYIDGEWELNDNEPADKEIVETEEETKPDIEEYDGYYILRSGNREVKASKNLVRRLKELYCGPEHMTINQVCRELEISRPVFYLIKNAFNITHDDVPYIDEDIVINSTDDLADQQLQKEKRQYFLKLEKKRVKKLEREVKKYRDKEYYINKVIGQLSEEIKKIDYRPPAFEFKEVNEDKTMLITLSDWHTGKLVESTEILGECQGFNQDIFEERKNDFANEIIALIKIFKPSKIIIVNTGDGLDDPEGAIYEGQKGHQDLQYESQVIEYEKALKNFILAIYDYQPNIEFIAIPGNHSSGELNYDILAARQVKMMLSEYESISFDTEKKKYKVRQIEGCNYVFTHGEDLRTGTNTRENDLLNIINRLGFQKEQTYVLQGHLHHKELQGEGYRHIMLPSIVGADDLSANIMNTGSRPEQMCFLLDNSGIDIEKNVYFD